MLPAASSNRDIGPKRRKYNEEEATSIAFWIEEVIDEDLEFPEDIIASLRNGIDLCRLVNELQPGIVNIINEDDNVFAHTSNIKEFLRACQMLGVNSTELLQIEDLSQNGDVQRVLRNIVALERAVVSRGWDGPKIELEDRCEREDCAVRIDNLLGEIGSLKRQLQEKDEENKELRQEKQDLVDKLMGKDAELSMIKMKTQNLETSSGVLNEKYKLALIDLQIAKQEYDALQKQFEDKKHPPQTTPPVPSRSNLSLASNSTPAAAVNPPTIPPIPLSSASSISFNEDIKTTPYRASASFIGPTKTTSYTSPQRSISPDTARKISALGGLGPLPFFQKTNSSPDLKKLEDMKKFIKKEKKELLRQEKEKKKKEDKEKEDREKEEREKEREREKEKEKERHDKEKQEDKDRHEKEKEMERQEKEREKERHEREKEKENEEDNRPKLSRAIRSITQVKFIKHKDKRLTSKDKLDINQITDIRDIKEPEPSPRSKSEINVTIDAKCAATTGKPNRSPPSHPRVSRERSYTAAARLFSVFKPASTTEGTSHTPTPTPLPIA